MTFEIVHINRAYQKRFETLHSHHLIIQQNDFKHKHEIVSGIYRTIPGCNIETIKARLQFDYENTRDCLDYEIIGG